jgi:hypothetical protein
VLKVISFPFSGFNVLQSGIQTALGIDLTHELSHDFDTTDPINPTDKHIVLIRGFEMAVDDWHKDQGGDFIKFRDSKSAYFDRFIEKWVNTTEVPNRLTITYLDLVDNTMNTIIRACRFITDSQLSDTAIDKLRVHIYGERPETGFKIAETPLSLIDASHTVD